MAPARITVTPHGAYRVTGDFELVDEEGNPYGLGGRTSIALCRCGQSGNIPFCDGTHGRCGFRDLAHARDLPARP